MKFLLPALACWPGTTTAFQLPFSTTTPPSTYKETALYYTSETELLDTENEGFFLPGKSGNVFLNGPEIGNGFRIYGSIDPRTGLIKSVPLSPIPDDHSWAFSVIEPRASAPVAPKDPLASPWNPYKRNKAKASLPPPRMQGPMPPVIVPEPQMRRGGAPPPQPWPPLAMDMDMEEPLPPREDRLGAFRNHVTPPQGASEERIRSDLNSIRRQAQDLSRQRDRFHQQEMNFLRKHGHAVDPQSSFFVDPPPMVGPDTIPRGNAAPDTFGDPQSPLPSSRHQQEQSPKRRLRRVATPHTPTRKPHPDAPKVKTRRHKNTRRYIPPNARVQFYPPMEEEIPYTIPRAPRRSVQRATPRHHPYPQEELAAARSSSSRRPPPPDLPFYFEDRPSRRSGSRPTFRVGGDRINVDFFAPLVSPQPTGRRRAMHFVEYQPSYDDYYSPQQHSYYQGPYQRRTRRAERSLMNYGVDYNNAQPYQGSYQYRQGQRAGRRSLTNYVNYNHPPPTNNFVQYHQGQNNPVRRGTPTPRGSSGGRAIPQWIMNDLSIGYGGGDDYWPTPLRPYY